MTHAGLRPENTPCPCRCQVTKRTGWIRKDVQGPESIADHMYRMSMMALIANDASVDQNRCRHRKGQT